MNSLNISYLDFLDIIYQDVLENVICFNRYIVNYFHHNPDQRSIINVDSDTEIPTDVKSCFKGFSVNFENTFTNVSRYIVFIDPNEDPIECYRKNVAKYLPLGKDATHVCILSDDLSVVENTYSILVESNPNLTLVQKTVIYNHSGERFEKAKAMIGDESRMLVMKDYCERLDSIYSESSIYFIKEFEKTVQEILSLCDGKIIVFGGDYQSTSYTIFKLFVAELYIRNARCKFYVESYDTPEFLTYLGSSVFKPECMLVEDVANFLVNLPELVAEIKQDFLVYHLINSRHLSFKASFVPLNDLHSSKVVNKSLNYKDIKILPFSKYYNMCTDDFFLNVRVEKECRTFIHSLYNVLNVPNDEILSVVNVFFFLMDGVEYVGYLRDYSFKAKCISNMIGMKATELTLDFEDVRRLSFLDCCLNVQYILKSFQVFSSKKTLNLNSVRPVRTFKDFSSIYRVYSVNNDYFFDEGSSASNKYWSDMPHSVFNCGMYSPMSVKFRTGLYLSLTKKLGIDYARSMLDSFGGFNLVTNPYIELTIRRRDI